MNWDRLMWTLAFAAVTAAAPVGCAQVLEEAAIDFYAQGRLAMEAKQYDEALAELAKAIKANPKLSVAHAAIGDIYRRTDRPDQAVGPYEQACNANPYAFRPHYNLGVTYQMLADSAEVAKRATEYVRKAISVYLRAVTLKPSDFETNLNLSNCYYQQGKFDLAEYYCKAAIELEPTNPLGKMNLGTIHDVQNRPYDAIAAYKASLELDIHQPELLIRLGITYRDLRREKDALRVFELAAAQDPDNPGPYVQIGSCHYDAKDYAAAMAAYEQAAEIDPKHAPAYRGLGVVYLTQWIVTQGPDDLRDKALDAWHHSLDLNSNQPILLKLIKKYRPKVTGPEL